MEINHGVSGSEEATSLLTPVESTASLPVVFGTAPVNLSTGATFPVNVPVLCYSFPAADKSFGYSDDFAKYTLSEFMDSHYRLFNLSPVVFVNVLDPATHKKTVAPAGAPLVQGMATIKVEGILKGSVVVKSTTTPDTTYVLDTDYTLSFDDEGYLVVSVKSGGSIGSETTLQVGYDMLDPAAVDSSDIIGGVDVNGKLTGLELIKQVFPRFGLVPGLILAPGYSEDPLVAAVMTAKASMINGVFNAIALTDLPTDEIMQYADAPAWKNSNNYTNTRQVPCWPMVSMSGKKYRFSTQLAGAIGATDAANNGIPFASPSNKALKANAAVLQDGTEVFLGLEEANYLNTQGIMTALNFIGGWKTWGNYTGAFPAVTDPKDSLIPVRRMFDFVINSLILTYWNKVDDPTNRRLIETVTDGANIWLNGLTSSGYLLGGRVEFRREDNPDTELMAGRIKFRVFLTPPSPAQSISFVLEYDTSYLAALAA
ncbi:phage tail sheath family protein [Brevibacillus centrosporus]|uniref:phage tail sheath family protein n=2 Tax=Brevibacillus centrosporus TaxID=54910 RepID=UPI000F09DEF7|nr:phage tail sheath family protein [Brevibacillus centrosporus]MEC2128135.1 phage tail sheath family protein [Brevibacillus centrosporus]RNB63809.1 phage tail sheath family protein [Brevibacillus centrosporus]